MGVEYEKYQATLKDGKYFVMHKWNEDIAELLNGDVGGPFDTEEEAELFYDKFIVDVYHAGYLRCEESKGGYNCTIQYDMYESREPLHGQRTITDDFYEQYGPKRRKRQDGRGYVKAKDRNGVYSIWVEDYTYLTREEYDAIIKEYVEKRLEWYCVWVGLGIKYGDKAMKIVNKNWHLRPTPWLPYCDEFTKEDCQEIIQNNKYIQMYIENGYVDELRPMIEANLREAFEEYIRIKRTPEEEQEIAEWVSQIQFRMQPKTAPTLKEGYFVLVFLLILELFFPDTFVCWVMTIIGFIAWRGGEIKKFNSSPVFSPERNPRKDD